MNKQIEDEEQTVDTRKKRQILDRREDLDEWEMELYTQVSLNEMRLQQADQLWGYRVRSYLKAVEPVLKPGELEHATEVYEEASFGAVRIPPPESLQNPQANGLEIKGDTPTPKMVEINGVKQVIETKHVGAQWDVQVRDANSPKRRKTLTQSNSRPLSYPVLENAVRTVDEWLQMVGVGLDIDDRGEDIITHFDMSGDEPQAEYGRGEYSGDPDI